jgi:Xaa-Pro dipeptidase
MGTVFIMNISTRIKNIFKQNNGDLDAILISNAGEPYIDINFFYVTGITKGIFERCSVVLFPDGSGELLITALEAENATRSPLPQTLFETSIDYQEKLSNILSTSSHIGINNQALLYSDYLTLKERLPRKTLIDVSNAINIMRMRKENDEIQHIKKACDIAVTTMNQIPDAVSIGMTEDELAAEINYLLLKNGAETSAFEIISSFGEHTAIPHYTHGSRRLKNGDFILCDFGARYKRYNSDITRTFVFGNATLKQKRMHEIVKNAQQKAIESIKPNVIASTVHQITKEVIDASEFAGSFIHSTGHSLGLLVHDVGVGFHSQSQIPLQSQMVLTVEPGIYLSGYGGIRIEDDICVTEDGCRILTDQSSDLTEI